MKSLGARLDRIADLVHTYGPFSCLADIGSDHAFLAIRTMQNADASLAVASDIRSGPLARGRESASRSGVFPEFRLSDGFDALGEFTFDAACICGMGGELIADILHRHGICPDCTYFLQPMTAQDDLRAFLWNNGYTVVTESYVCERGKPYAVLIVRHTGRNTVYSYADLFLGQVRPIGDDAFRAYAEKVASQAQKRRTGALARMESTENEDALLRECAEIKERE